MKFDTKHFAERKKLKVRVMEYVKNTIFDIINQFKDNPNTLLYQVSRFITFAFAK